MSSDELHIVGDMVVGLSPLVTKNNTEAGHRYFEDKHDHREDLDACIEALSIIATINEVENCTVHAMGRVSTVLDKLPEHIKARLK